MKKILIIHGVNLNMFGKRDPAQYGTITLAEINQHLESLAKELGVELLRASRPIMRERSAKRSTRLIKRRSMPL